MNVFCARRDDSHGHSERPVSLSEPLVVAFRFRARSQAKSGGITHTQTEARTAGASRNANPWGWCSYQDAMSAKHTTAHISRDSSWHYQEGLVWLHQNLWLLCCVSQLLCEMFCSQVPLQPLSPHVLKSVSSNNFLAFAHYDEVPSKPRSCKYHIHRNVGGGFVLRRVA